MKFARNFMVGFVTTFCLLELFVPAQSTRPVSVELTVEKSTNLIDWQPFAVVTIPDPASATQAHAFYRIVTNR